MQNNRREIQPPHEKEDEDMASKEDESGETEKDKATSERDQSFSEGEIKDEMAAEEGKEEMVVGDDGNWKRAKKREDEDEDGKKLTSLKNCKFLDKSTYKISWQRLI